MCRRCGEPDGRGPAHQRRDRRLWLASPASGFGGDGTNVCCWNWDVCRTVVCIDDRWGRAQRMEVDRIVPGWQCVVCFAGVCQHGPDVVHAFRGGTYRRSNIRPSCGPCNRSRNRGNPWQLGQETRCLTG